MTTVVTLSTYRFPHPKSGGPRRLHEISKVYKRAGWRVQSVVVRDPHANDGSYPADIEFELPESGRHRLFDGRMLPEIADVLTAAYVSSEDFAFPSLAGKLAEDTRLIHVEQPWLWPLACRIREYYRDRYIPILYSSANIESFLKAEIYSSLGLDFPDDLRSAIHELEAAAAHADGVAAVTCFDADALKALGARKVVIASNGVSEPAASDETLASWRTKLPKVPWALYVASGYRPNYSDFIEVF